MTRLSRVVALVPTYNGARHLGETLASLAAQDHAHLHVVISDDASTDDTPAIYEAFRADDRFRVVRQPRRLGWIDNSNYLLAEADGDHAFFAPHDDVFAPTYARRLVEALDARSDAVLAFSDTTAVGDHAYFRPLAREARDGSRLRRALRYVPDSGHERCLPFRGLVRADARRAAGPLRRSVLGEFDADGRWLFRLALLGPFVRVPEPLCAKRLHAESLAASWSYGRRTWALDALSYIGEAHRAGLTQLEFAALSAAAAAQGLVHLLPRQYRPRVSRLRTRCGV